MNYFKRPYLLVSKWILLNSLVVWFFAYLFYQGLAYQVFEGDITGIVYVITIIAILSVLYTGYLALKLSKEFLLLSKGWTSDLITRLDKGSIYEKTKNPEYLVAEIVSRTMVIDYAGKTMVTLGLIGTLVGFIYVFMSINLSEFGNYEAIGKIIGEVLIGMGIAIYTTLVGSIGFVWVDINSLIIKNAVVKLSSGIYAMSRGHDPRDADRVILLEDSN